MGLGLVLLAGCHTMRAVQPAQLGTARELSVVWVTRSDRSTVVVRGPEVRADTLIGFVDGAYHEMPLSEVVSISAREAAHARTAALVVGSLAVTSVLLVYLGNRSYVGGDAQTCTSGLTTGDVQDILPVACCRVQIDTPC
jgi:hypothetical protein